MLQLFHNLVSYIKGGEITTDGLIFRLSSKYTGFALFGCGILITTSLVIGEVIMCIPTVGDEDYTKFANTYCWNQPTYTIPSSEYRLLHDEHYDEGRRYHRYYWWVPIVLFLQGMFCLLPKWLWDSYENNLLQCLLKGINNVILPQDNINNTKRALLRYFLSRENLYNCYAIRYWFFEISSLVITLGQIVFMDYFLDGEFNTYGFKVLTFLVTPDDERIDPMAYTFPKLTKCEYHIYGPSGTLQNRDALCILPQNNLNQVIYVLFWFWFVIMAIFQLIQIVLLLVLMCSTQLRVVLLRRHNYQLINTNTAESICHWADLNHLWVLYMLGVNIQCHFFPELLEGLAGAINDSEVRDGIMDPSKDDPKNDDPY